MTSAHGTHVFKARAGHHLAPQLLSCGHDVFERLGSGFTLIALGADETAVQTFERAAQSLRVPLSVIRDTAALCEAYEFRLILVRPDQYVAWAGDDLPRDPEELLGVVTGRTPSAPSR